MFTVSALEAQETLPATVHSFIVRQGMATNEEEDSGVVAKRVNVALSGRVGLASATPATTPPSTAVETTCSAATTPAATSIFKDR